MTGPSPRSIRRESRDLAGKFRTCVLAPVMATPFLPGEGGMLSQAVSFEAQPVLGRMLSEAYAKVVSVYVPAPAMHKLQYNTDPNADIPEIIRRKIMNGQQVFPASTENEITKRLGIVPQKQANAYVVNRAPLIAYNVAINYLAKRLYTYATQRTAGDITLCASLLSSTALQWFNGALDPDDHINGNVELALSSTQAPVTGIGILSNDGSPVNRSRRETKGTVGTGLAFQVRSNSDGALQNAATLSIAAQSNNATSLPAVYADLSAVMASGFSLVDLYNAQKADDITRQMRAIADGNPTLGEDAVLRWAFGLSADVSTEPFVIFEKEIALGDAVRRATDATGLQDEVRVSELGQLIEFSVPVPRTELGGIVVTFAQVRPDEVIAQQPHTIFTSDWTMPSQPAEMMKVDPEPVLRRDLFADTTAAAQETEVMFYAGHNALKRHYTNVGYTRQVVKTDVEAQTVMWQYAIPAGVNPSNIFYPNNFPQYPWGDNTAEVITYRVVSQAVIETDIFFGPDPVETVAIIDSKNLLGA